MSAPESTRDRLARRARELRDKAAQEMAAHGHAESVAALIGAAIALEEIVLALDALAENWPGDAVENAARGAENRQYGDGTPNPPRDSGAGR